MTHEERLWSAILDLAEKEPMTPLVMAVAQVQRLLGPPDPGCKVDPFELPESAPGPVWKVPET